jgi:hypothetical protein
MLMFLFSVMNNSTGPRSGSPVSEKCRSGSDVDLPCISFARIGQTREVHIFRLVTEHSIEENILLKARQKRNLDIMVMDRGNFTTAEAEKPESLTNADVQDVYTKGGLREILGVSKDGDGMDIVEDETLEVAEVSDGKLSSEQIEKTMASLEDADDAEALKGARQEVADDLKEFDESIEYKRDSDAEEPDEVEKEVTAEPEKDDTKELEQQIASWQENDGMDAATIEASLTAIERYGLRLREEIDPYESVFAVLHRRQLEETKAEQDNEILVRLNVKMSWTNKRHLRTATYCARIPILMTWYDFETCTGEKSRDWPPTS